MTNLFDAANALKQQPTEFVTGDFVQWKREDIAATYPTSEGYTAEYVARIDGGVSEFKVPQAAGSTDQYYLFAITSVESAGILAGTYRWQLELTQTSSGNRIVLERGTFIIQPDMDVDSADSRSHARIMVAKIESLLEGRADTDVASYSVAGRSLTKMSFSELLEARNFFKNEVAQEKAKEDAKLGLKGSTTIKVRF